MNKTSQRTCPGRSRRGGFTLIELLVVISIILLLIGIGVGVFKIANQKGFAQQTKTILGEVRAAISEYQSETGIVPSSDSSGSIGKLVQQLVSRPQVQKMLVNLGPDVYQAPTYTGGVANNDGMIFDAGGIPLRYYQAYNGSAFPHPQNNVPPMVMAAGPDGEWGDRSGSATDKQQESDNIYSTEIR